MAYKIISPILTLPLTPPGTLVITPVHPISADGLRAPLSKSALKSEVKYLEKRSNLEHQVLPSPNGLAIQPLYYLQGQLVVAQVHEPSTLVHPGLELVVHDHDVMHLAKRLKNSTDFSLAPLNWKPTNVHVSGLFTRGRDVPRVLKRGELTTPDFCAEEPSAGRIARHGRHVLVLGEGHCLLLSSHLDIRPRGLDRALDRALTPDCYLMALGLLQAQADLRTLDPLLESRVREPKVKILRQITALMCCPGRGISG